MFSKIDALLTTARWALLLALILMTAWLYQQNVTYKSELERTENNIKQLITEAKLNYVTQSYSPEEMSLYIDQQRSEFKAWLDANKIKDTRIKELVTTHYKYVDSGKKEYDVTKVADGVKTNRPDSIKWVDSTKCLTVKGTVKFDGDKLKVTVDHREARNTSTGVIYLQRKQWKFLGIKSRLFGKLQDTAVVYDECGQTRLIHIKKKPK
jgi:predicted nucleic-acid-binding protein